MDALVCLEPGRLAIETRPAPLRAEGDVLVRPRRVGICGTDYHIFEGKHPFLTYPRVMGHELAVEVVQAPTDSDFRSGEVVVVNPYLSCGRCIACRRGKPNCCTSIAVLGVHRDGGMTKLLSLPPSNLLRADGLSLDACATVEFLAIGAHAVRRGMVAAATPAAARHCSLRAEVTTARVDTESASRRSTSRPISAYRIRAACMPGRHGAGSAPIPPAARS